MAEADALGVDDLDAHPGGPSRGRIIGVTLLSVLTPGLGHIKLGRWQVGLLLVGVAQGFLIGLRALPNLMAPTPQAVMLLVATGVGLLALLVGAALHAWWMARREIIQTVTISRGPTTYVPLPLDVRVREAGPNMEEEDGTQRPATTWITAACLIVVGVATAILLPARWALITMPAIAMGPTLSAGDRVLVDRHRVGLVPRRGEIVLLHSGDEDRPFIVRRVIGTSGDRLVIRRLALVLNGNRETPQETSDMFTVDGVDRPVWTETLPGTQTYRVLLDGASKMVDEPKLIVVSPGQVLVMRDDRVTPVSTAGSVSGTASVSEIEGTVTTILWKQSGGGFLRRL